MRYVVLAMLLAGAITAGIFSVSKPDEPIPVVTAEDPEPEKEESPVAKPEKKPAVKLPPKPVKKQEKKEPVKKDPVRKPVKKADQKEEMFDTLLAESLSQIDSRLLGRRTATLKEMFERLPHLSDDDKKLLAKLILLHDQNNYGSNSDPEFARHIDDQIANLLGDDYDKFEQRSTYKMLNDLHNILKKEPLQPHQEPELINYFNRNMDSQLLNKVIAAEFNREGFKGEHSPLMDAEPLKEQINIWVKAPVTEGQAETMKNVHSMIMIGLGRAQIEADLKKLEDK